jgi:hypothetical protein
MGKRHRGGVAEHVQEDLLGDDPGASDSAGACQ